MEALWPLIQTQLDEAPTDTSFHAILLLVRGHCEKETDCLLETYDLVRKKLELQFNLPVAVFVCEELVRVAQETHKTEWEAKGYKNLYRYYDALGNHRKATVCQDNAIDLYQKSGNEPEVFYLRLGRLEKTLEYRDPDEVLFDMFGLMEEAKAAGLTGSVNHIRLRLVYQLIDYKRFAELALQLDTLAQLPVDTPYSKLEHPIRMAVAWGGAEVARASGLKEDARTLYQRALAIAEAEPARWHQVNVLLNLVSLERELHNPSAAENYLQQAITLAEALEIHDLLVEAYKTKAQMAEEKGQYAAALSFFKKEAYHESRLHERKAGFDQRSYYLELEKEQLATEKEKQDLELRLRRTQLTGIMAGLILTLLLAAGFFLAYTQSQKRKRALAEQNALIQQQAARLESLDSAKSRFFANVSHELRTPLTLLHGPIHSLLKDTNLDEKQLQLLRMAERSGKQLEQLVTEILDLSKLQMGKMELNEQPTDLASYFRMYCAQFESLALRREVQYSFHIDAGNTVVVLLDQEKFRQILYNLLSNAFKFTPGGGAVAANVSLREGNLTLTVSDTGSGIHPEDLPHLFERYFQTNRPEGAAEGGTGIGLALCAEYTRLMNGDIRVDSILGKGATFQVSVPVKKGRPSDRIATRQMEHYPEMPIAYTPSVSADLNDQQAASAEKASRAAGPKPSILLVEDNPELQTYIRLVLAEHYDIQTAEHGLAAFNKLTAVEPVRVDLVITDIMMPVMDGYQLLEKLKSDDATRHLPVVMLTARADAQDKLRALRVGVDDYLLKPFDEEELKARIDNLLQYHKARQAEAGSDDAKEQGAGLSALDRDWLETYEQYIRMHLTDDTLTVPGMAYAFAMSESTLLRQLKRLTGLSPQQYLLEMRLQEARNLLENRACHSIREVASQVGYYDAKSFSKRFKQRFGKQPAALLER